MNNNSILLEKELRECPICGKEHEIEKRKRIEQIKIKDLIVNYDEIYYNVLMCQMMKIMNLFQLE